MRFLFITLFAAGTAFSPLAAQEAGQNEAGTPAAVLGLTELVPAQIRRLDHYANKILSEIGLLAEAEAAQDSQAQKLPTERMQELAARFLNAATDSGLSDREADAYFQTTLALNYSGRLPKSLDSGGGIPSILALLEGVPQTGTDENGNPEDIVDYLRNEGAKTFSD